MSVDGIVAGLRNTIRNVSGLRRVYDEPPESMQEFPCAFVYLAEGEYSVVASGQRDFHTLVVEIHESGTVVPQAVAAARRWPDAVMAAIRADETLGNTVDHVVWPLRYRCLPIVYGNETHYGVSFQVRVKTHG